MSIGSMPENIAVLTPSSVVINLSNTCKDKMFDTDNSGLAKVSYEPVADFYAGKSIFITGGTGFLGKVLIEKLLYSCSNVGNIYVMLREKKNTSYQDRAKSYFDSPVFNRLNKENPESLQKIKFVNGDLSLDNIGISSEDLTMLQEEVSIVFHFGATVKFNEPLPVAMKVNVEGTEEVLKLSQSMKKIKVFIYMSTIYSSTNYERRSIEEKFYPIPMPIDEVYKMIKDNDQNKVYTPEMLDGRPNTYTFTKALAEYLILEKRGNLPTIIIRPSAVTAAIEEPVKGWLSGWMGPTPYLYLVGLGCCRTLYGTENSTCDIIPVDYVANLSIITAAKHIHSKEIAIYHSCSSGINPLTLGGGFNNFVNEWHRQGFNILPFPGVVFTTSEWVMTLRRLILEVLPAYVVDFVFYLLGKPGRFIKIQQRLAVELKSSRYFFLSFLLKMKNGPELFRSLSTTDQRTFPCDPADYNWKNYWPTYVKGVKQYLAKEKQN